MPTSDDLSNVSPLSTSRSPPMRRIQDLPEELLLYIFSKGSEDEIFPITFEHTGPSRHRRRKVIVEKARKVCNHWRNLIDDTHQTRFWIANLGLTLDKDDSLAFAQQLVLFRKILSDSNGCDLTISFDFRGVEDHWWRDLEQLPDEDRILARLFLYGMSFVVPYSSQVVSLSADLPQPQAAKYCLQLLAQMISLPDPRLMALRIAYLPPQSAERPLNRSLLDVCNSSCTSGFNLPLEHPHTIHNTFDLRHARNLDTLMITHSTWLKEIQLPLSISHLDIFYSPGVNLLFTNLSSQASFCTNLVSMTLSGPDERASVDNGLRLSLDRLRKLDIPGASDIWVEHLLHRIKAPSLEDVTIDLSSLQSEGYPLSKLYKLTTELRSSTKYFEHLDFEFPISWSILASLRVLILFPVLRLRIRHNHEVKRQNLQLGEETNLSSIPGYREFLRFLSRCRYRKLSLQNIPTFSYLLAILSVVDAERLQKLHLGLRPSTKDDPASSVHPFRLLAPILVELTLDGLTTSQAEFLLAHISADRLQKISRRIDNGE